MLDRIKLLLFDINITLYLINSHIIREIMTTYVDRNIKKFDEAYDELIKKNQLI